MRISTPTVALWRCNQREYRRCTLETYSTRIHLNTYIYHKYMCHSDIPSSCAIIKHHIVAAISKGADVCSSIWLQLLRTNDQSLIAIHHQASLHVCWESCMAADILSQSSFDWHTIVVRCRLYVPAGKWFSAHMAASTWGAHVEQRSAIFAIQDTAAATAVQAMQTWLVCSSRSWSWSPSQ